MALLYQQAFEIATLVLSENLSEKRCARTLSEIAEVEGTMGRKGDYLYRRSGSTNWYLRLVNPPELAAELGRPRTEVSLGTPHRVEAEALAAQHIGRHKMALLAIERQRAGKPLPVPGSDHHRYPPNTSAYVDGVRVVATDDQLLFFNAIDDVFLRSEPNRIEVSLTNAIDLAMAHPGYLRPNSAMMVERAVRAIRPTNGATSRHMMHKTDRILDNWIERRQIGKHVEAEAREAWRLFCWLANHRPLPQCNRADALKLVNHLQGEGNKSKTIEKKLSHLRAAVQLAVDDGIFSGANPFSRVLQKVGFDSERRLPLSEADMAKARTNLHLLSEQDQLLWVILATTGMRLGEPFPVVEEFESDLEGIRYIFVGTKTQSSVRRVPLPPEVKKRLKSRIRGPIFSESAETHGKRLRRFLQRLDISYDPKRGTGDSRKTVHSLRHRAADRLREARCQDSMRYALLGHELITVAEGYGEGYSISEMRFWQDRIGY